MPIGETVYTPKIFTLLFFICFFASCTNTEKTEKGALESSIREFNSVYDNYLANRDLERDFQSINPQKHFGRYRDRFQEIRNAVAKQPKTDKYVGFRSEINRFITISIEYFNSQILIYNKNEDIINTTKTYRDNLEYFKSRFKSDEPGGDVRNFVNTTMGKMYKDSTSFRERIQELKPIDSVHDSLANQIYMSKNKINSKAKQFNLSDTITVSFDDLYYSPGGSSYEYFSNKEIRPMEDVVNFMAEVFKSNR